MSPRRTKWSFSAGTYPNTVRVFERETGGTLYASAWDPSAGFARRISLRHKDRELAIQYAKDEEAKLRQGGTLAPSPTIGYVTMQYLVHRTPKKVLTVQKEDSRRVDFWRAVLGVHRQISTLGRSEWEHVIAIRSSGAVDARGRAVSAKERRVVAPRTVDADLVFINAVFNWATTWNVNGRPILDRNPWGGSAAGVKRALERPKSIEIKQPVATFDRFLAIRAAAPSVMMEVRQAEPGSELVEVGRATFKHGEGPVRKWMKPSYLPELLDLVEATGRRITSICRLRYSDFVRESGRVVRIRWRSIKGSKPATIPLNERAQEAVARILEQRPGIGETYVFPSPRKPDLPTSRYLARDWLERAEQLAGLDRQSGGDWHPYRRKWATERKHWPTVDVMKTGDWKDERSLKNSYIKSDDETILAVVNEPKKLREKA